MQARLELGHSSRIASASSELAAFHFHLRKHPEGRTSMSSTRPECSSGTENVNRHADGEGHGPRSSGTCRTRSRTTSGRLSRTSPAIVLLVHPGSERQAIEAMRTVSQVRRLGTPRGLPAGSGPNVRTRRGRALSRSPPRTWQCLRARPVARTCGGSPRQITTKAPWAPDPPRLKQRRTLVPFTQDEVARLWGDRQRPEHEDPPSPLHGVPRARSRRRVAHEMWKANVGDLGPSTVFLCVQ